MYLGLLCTALDKEIIKKEITPVKIIKDKNTKEIIITYKDYEDEECEYRIDDKDYHLVNSTTKWYIKVRINHYNQSKSYLKYELIDTINQEIIIPDQEVIVPEQEDYKYKSSNDKSSNDKSSNVISK